ncbi:mitochondrial import inner membrane translocase subunit Tim21 [Nomia melanderi]|uniref:mitochondrial import inner membrane translocase subunit Tim21 n=1 Tax=Nomia melanderi TaxID=2448451 RepID=UPI00130403A6|nr:mitochondrial import inner membrane translocase subunit Tim21 [Nomia melanderi]XP_031846610.1 mitochondrial import inner membrane translocase subunit Tim21 [Nomia melanderi]
MASIRVINYISCRRLIPISGLSRVRIFSHYDPICNVPQSVSFCTKKELTKANVTEQENRVQVGLAEVVKENTKSFAYLTVILGGLGITGVMFYAIFSELFSSKSANNVYSKALEDCKKNSKVRDALGEPIKAYGEESRRGRRSHLSHITFTKDGVKHMRMQFYVQGIRRRGTVSLEVQENESGYYEYRYLYVLIDDIFQTLIKIEDNRDKSTIPTTNTEFDTI